MAIEIRRIISYRSISVKLNLCSQAVKGPWIVYYWVVNIPRYHNRFELLIVNDLILNQSTI